MVGGYRGDNFERKQFTGNVLVTIHGKWKTIKDNHISQNFDVSTCLHRNVTIHIYGGSDALAIVFWKCICWIHNVTAIKSLI